MKLKQLTRHVWAGCAYWPVPVMVWIVEGHNGLTLVDGGLPSMWNPMHEALHTTFRGRSLNRILLTHGHGDHVGMLYALTEHLQLPITAHEFEIPFLSGEKSYTTLRPGSVNKDIQPGDLFTIFFGKLRRPIEKFTANMEESLQSGALVARLKPKLTACAHFGVVKDASIQYINLV